MREWINGAYSAHELALKEQNDFLQMILQRIENLPCEGLTRSTTRSEETIDEDEDADEGESGSGSGSGSEEEKPEESEDPSDGP